MGVRSCGPYILVTWTQWRSHMVLSNFPVSFKIGESDMKVVMRILILSSLPLIILLFFQYIIVSYSSRMAGIGDLFPDDIGTLVFTYQTRMSLLSP